MVFDPKGAQLAVEQYKRARGAFAEAVLDLTKTPQVGASSLGLCHTVCPCLVFGAPALAARGIISPSTY